MIRECKGELAQDKLEHVRRYLSTAGAELDRLCRFCTGRKPSKNMLRMRTLCVKPAISASRVTDSVGVAEEDTSDRYDDEKGQDGDCTLDIPLTSPEPPPSP